MKAYVFPGQGSQFVGMGKDLFDRYEETKKIFKVSDEILGFKISEILLEGSKEASSKPESPNQQSIFTL